jgi:AraC family transcriptional regulator
MTTMDIKTLPRDVARRCIEMPHGMTVESVRLARGGAVECRFRAPVHLLVAYERGERRQGESAVEGVPRSALRSLERKLTFVPAGHEFREWLTPHTPTSLLYFYFDPADPLIRSKTAIAEAALAPRLFFEDATLWSTAVKLLNSIESPAPESLLYAEALGLVLVHELIRLDRGRSRSGVRARGGLAAWQQRAAIAYVEEHLAEDIPLAALARLVHLSPYHFCRAFKQSFGVPPHRYHIARRVERAKDLLARRTASVTEIGLQLGFSETSSFSSAFRRATGQAPSHYLRGAG